MKEFHIINVGNSLLTNFKRVREDIKEIDFSENKKWENLLNDSNFLKDIYNFLSENPSKNSAEMNSFLKMVKDKNPSDIHVYLIGTKTASNEICKLTIEGYLKENGFKLYEPPRVPGYFFESENYDKEIAKDEFTKGLSNLLDKILYVAKKKKEEGFEVYINPTGGFKPHVIISALAGFLTDCNVYYIHEEFDQIINLPRLFYIPKGREIELLRILSDKVPRSGKNFEKLLEKYENEIERLKIYGLIETEKDELCKEFRIKITERGLTYFKFIEKKEV